VLVPQCSELLVEKTPGLFNCPQNPLFICLHASTTFRDKPQQTTNAPININITK
jgi:hypothetical protein